MTVSTSILAYQDCIALLDQAMADPLGARTRVPSHDAAIHLRTRIHYARKLHRDENKKTYDVGHPMHGCSEYDALTIRIKFDEDDNCFVYLEKTDKPQGAVEGLSQVEPKPMQGPPPMRYEITKEETPSVAVKIGRRI